MDETMREKIAPEEEKDAMVLSREGEKLYVLSHAESGRSVQVDEHTAARLVLLESLGETEKSRRLASRFTGEEIKKVRLDAALLAEIAVNRGKEHGMREAEYEQKADKKGDDRNTVLDAHITGVGTAGDFHLTARVQNENSGEVREVKGMVTGLDAALLRSNTNEEEKEGTVLRNAQVLASENFEKGMSAAFAKNNAVTMKMD